MNYVLAYPTFDDAVTRRLNAFRTAHEPERAKLVRPHVTLVFGVRSVLPSDFIAFCTSQIGNMVTIPVTFDNAKIAHDPYDKAYKMMLSVSKGRAALTDLHKRLYDGPHRQEFDNTIPYQPHMTVATNPNRAALDLIDISAIGTFPIQGTIREIEIVALQDGSLERLQGIALQP
ncbi:MAG: 2'-5' RNA ligase family protein [Paracoccaceae bacterium]|nr:2'-5' RNA ligase family protein [Paracoccaceae bacterium]